MENADRRQVVGQVRELLSLAELAGEPSQDVMGAAPNVDGHRCWPAQPEPCNIESIARLARRLAFWAIQGISDSQIRDRSFELARWELNRQAASVL
jgi:hypothetical protein